MTRVLIVDDDEQNLYMLRVLLEGHGYKVTSAANGSEALDKARQDPPDVIVADVLMPVMDGFTLCREWQRDEQLKRIPFVFYTATYTDPKDEALALSLGAERFIVKPMEPEAFAQVVEETIREAEAGRLAAPSESVVEEPVYLRQHSERLVHKLEDKMLQLERTGQRLTALHLASAALSSLLPPDELVSQTLRAVVEAMAFVNGLYFAYDEAQQAFHLREAIGFPADVLEEFRQRLTFHLGEERGLVGVVGQTRRPLIVADTKRDPRWVVLDGTARSALLAPVVHQDRLLGVVSFLSARVGDFGDADVTNVTILANSLSIAIENARLVEDLRQSEAKFRALAETAPAAIFIYQDTGFRYVNPTAEALTGYSAAELLEMSFWDVVSPDFRDLVKARGLARQKGEPVPSRYEFKIVTKSGEERWLDFAAGRIEFEGHPAAIGTAYDITGRKRAQEEIHSLSQFRASVIENANVWLDVLDERADVVIWNKAAEEISGYSREEVVGHGRIWEWLYPEEAYRDEITAKAAAIIERGEVVEDFETTIRCKDGEERVISWHSRNLVDERGHPIGSIALGRDVTRRKQAEEALRQHAERLSALHETDQAILAARSPEDIAQAALGCIRQLVRCLGASVVRFDPNRQEAILFAVHGDDALALEAGSRLPLGGTAEIEALEQGQDLIEEDISSLPVPPPAIQALRAGGVRSYIAIPLITQGALIGALGLGSESPGPFPAESLQIAREVAAQLAVALHQADLRAALEAEQQKLEVLVEHLPEGLLLLDAGRRILLANPAARAYLASLIGEGEPSAGQVGQVLTHLAGRPLDEFLSPPPKGFWHDVEISGPSYRYFQVVARPVELGANALGWVFVLQDATEQRQGEDRARQQERLVAIGQLAGGVAHDFNNLLTVMGGYAEFLSASFADDDSRLADVREIQGAVDRAASLTRQLLAFSRKQVLQPRVLDLNAVVANIEKMLRRLIGEDIDLVTVLDPNVGQVEADPGQIEQVIVNLVVNARDAMPQGGRLVIETADVYLDERYAEQHADVKPGSYVMLAVNDTGIGMDEVIRSHLFEPFFTTKERGRGTGLGLATVYGIVKQSGGDIQVSSEPGAGTTFRIHLPRVEKAIVSTGIIRAAGESLSGQETILLVEDEDVVRDLARRALVRQSYTVLEARDGVEALRICEEYPGPIHLAITDVVMPGGTSGPDLADHLASSRPQTKVLYVSGYMDDAIGRHIVLGPGTSFLQKPFTPATLGRKVREVLDAP